MIYTVTAGGAVSFSPKSVAEEVAQNIRTIIATPLGAAPLARDIGLDHSAVDMPIPVAQSLIMSALVAAIAEQEPRAQVINVTFGSETDGKLQPIVQFSLAGEGGTI